MKQEKFPSKRVLVVGPGYNTTELLKKLYNLNVPVVDTADVMRKLLPSYFEDDVPRKAHKWRPLIDKATDLVLSAYCLLNVPRGSLIVTDRVSATFLSQTCDIARNKPLFIGSLDVRTIINKVNVSTGLVLDEQLAGRWVHRISPIVASHCGVVIDMKDQKFTDISKCVGIVRHQGEFQWTVETGLIVKG